MKKNILILLVYCLLPTAYCYCQTWQWAKQGGGTGGSQGYDFGIGVSVAKNGDCYATGLYMSNPAVFGTDSLYLQGCSDIFIVKYDYSGNLLWAKKAGGNAVVTGCSATDAGYAIATDILNNLYVTGYFTNQAIFDTATVISNGGVDIFTAKYNSSGNIIWVKNAGGKNSMGDVGYGIDIDPYGNVYVTGYFSGSATFDSHNITSPNSNRDAFIAKYNSNGDCLWVRQVNATISGYGFSIKSDSTGNCYVTGTFSGTATIGAYSLSLSGNGGMFIAKYDSSGNCVWAKSAANAGPTSISIDANNNSYVTGAFRGNATFDSFTLSGTGNDDIFIAKYNANGSSVWAKQGGGAGYDDAYGIATTASGTSFITGLSSSNALLLGTCSLSSNGTFVAKLDSSGNCNWIAQSNAIGLGVFSTNAISIDTSGNPHITGSFQNIATFGSTTLTSAGQNDVFVAKLDGTTMGTPPQNGNRTGFTIYPNPSDGSYTMEISQDLLKSKMYIYNTLGQIIFETILSKNITTIDIPNLTQSVYIVKLQTPEGKNLQQSIVKQ